MKKIKALKSFSGAVTLAKGQVKDVPDSVAEDALKAGYAQEVENDGSKPKKGGKKNGVKSGDGK